MIICEGIDIHESDKRTSCERRHRITRSVTKLWALRLFSIAMLDFAIEKNATAQINSDLSTVTESRTRVVTKAEVRQIHELAYAYNAEMVFLTSVGQYIEGVEFEVDDSVGNSIVAGRDVGPIIRLNLESGWYVVNASFNGLSQKKRFLVRHNAHREIYFYWPIQNPFEVDAGRMQGIK